MEGCNISVVSSLQPQEIAIGEMGSQSAVGLTCAA